ncbi:hypothetical protein BC834DRAFT_975019 [Gloeopeniophorella convolvens]|nr:hypothetical protein BC834DRAFT_975019 [Gloeopeniophorella convolvens]
MSERDDALQFRVEAVEARALSEQLRTHVKSLEAVCNFLAKQPEALRNELESLKVQQELDKFRNTQLPGQVVDQDESLDGRDRKRRRTTASDETGHYLNWPKFELRTVDGAKDLVASAAYDGRALARSRELRNELAQYIPEQLTTPESVFLEERRKAVLAARAAPTLGKRRRSHDP